WHSCAHRRRATVSWGASHKTCAISSMYSEESCSGLGLNCQSRIHRTRFANQSASSVRLSGIGTPRQPNGKTCDMIPTLGRGTAGRGAEEGRSLFAGPTAWPLAGGLPASPHHYSRVVGFCSVESGVPWSADWLAHWLRELFQFLQLARVVLELASRLRE